MTETPKTEHGRKRFSVYYVDGCQAESCLGDDKMIAWLNRNISPHERLVSAHPKTMTDGRDFSVTWTLIVEDMLATQIVVQRANALRDAKIRSLEAQVERLRGMVFE